MNISLEFIIIVINIIVPGLLFRRFYFYGHFSKEFGAGYSLIRLIAVSSFAGLVIFSISSVCYLPLYKGNFFDLLKQVFEFYYNLKDNQDLDLNEYHPLKVLTITIFCSIFFGTTIGRTIRFLNIDKGVKILRFKNYWFYVFHGFLKMKPPKGKRLLFTQADMLINSSDGSKLYSGILKDYEVNNSCIQKLNTVTLTDTKRYTSNQSNKLIRIPGDLFVIDCSSLININITYIYTRKEKEILKILGKIQTFLTVGIFLSIPLFIFKIGWINYVLYNWYFSLRWYNMILVFLCVNAILNLLCPVKQISDNYRWLDFKEIIGRIVFILLYILVIYSLT